MSRNARAVATLERHSAEDLLDVLGLVTEDGTIPPDDDTEYVLIDPAKGPGSRNPDVVTQRREVTGLTTPPGLANLPPAAPAQPKKRRGPKPKEKVIRPRRERTVPECGTYKKVAWHRRHEGLRVVDMDDDCQRAAREYGQKMTAAYRQRKGAA